MMIVSFLLARTVAVALDGQLYKFLLLQQQKQYPDATQELCSLISDEWKVDAQEPGNQVTGFRRRQHK